MKKKSSIEKLTKEALFFAALLDRIYYDLISGADLDEIHDISLIKFDLRVAKTKLGIFYTEYLKQVMYVQQYLQKYSKDESIFDLLHEYRENQLNELYSKIRRYLNEKRYRYNDY